MKDRGKARSWRTTIVDSILDQTHRLYIMDELDQTVCLCFHITRRKLVNYLRVEKPRRAAQLSDCFGAGTGCGWCRPFLEKLFEEAVSKGTVHADIPSPAEYAQMRSRYVRDGGGTPPPGATPIS